tara:strand:+ start:411 stop:545 length:135 start_codon:yes stop_codon:yes gene_type:complete
MDKREANSPFPFSLKANLNFKSSSKAQNKNEWGKTQRQTQLQKL